MLKRLYLADVGGLMTTDGHVLRKGQVFRSSGLNPLSSEDLGRLRSLSIAHVVDLRDHGSVRRRPDLFVAPRSTHLPVRLAGMEHVRRRDILLRRVDWNALVPSNLYANMLDLNGAEIRTFLDVVASEKGAVLLHCSAGKDRTGVFVAILQLALGVPRAQVLQGYLAVKPHLDAHFPRSMGLMMRLLGVTPLARTVSGPHLVAMMDHLEARHGGAEGYVRSLGFSRWDELRERLRAPTPS